MTSMSTTSLVLKQDGLGRVQTPAARRDELLAEFARRGLSGARFAALAQASGGYCNRCGKAFYPADSSECSVDPRRSWLRGRIRRCL
jgi:hypothetical protein